MQLGTRCPSRKARCCCAARAASMRRPDSNPLDAIPEEILVQGASEFGEVLGPIAANDLKRLEAIREAGLFSLLQRDPDAKTLSIHRLLQEVLQWPLCARLLPHA